MKFYHLFHKPCLRKGHVPYISLTESPHFFLPCWDESPFFTVRISDSYKSAPKLGICQKRVIHIHSHSFMQLCSHKAEHVSDELIYFLNA